MRGQGSEPGVPSSRLLDLLAGDLPGYRRERDDEGRVQFVPADGGLVLGVASRTERRFLGRTEIAVFETTHAASLLVGSIVELKHTGGVRRSGITAVVKQGGGAVNRFAEALAADGGLIEATLTLDFTRFEVQGGPDGARSRVELMGASHVAIALPPIRSYVRLYPDQREALVMALERVGRVASRVGPAAGEG